MTATAKTRLPAAERRQAIVDAALRVFAGGSYSGSTTAEIARAAGISEPILYRHFASKRELYLACLESAWTSFRAALDARLDERGDREAIIAIGEASREFHASGGVKPVTLWIQALTEAGEDVEIRAFLRGQLRDAIEGDDDDGVMEEFERRHFFRGAAEPLELVRMREERNGAVYEAMWGRNEWTMTGALAGWDVRPRLGELRMPTLIVRGEHDLSTAAISKTLTDGIPHAREVVFGDSSHTPVLEETERYLRTVREFLYSVEAR